MFYFVLGNVLPLFRSKSRRIQLAALVNSEHMKQYGASCVLKPIIDDVKKLVSSNIKCLIGLYYV